MPSNFLKTALFASLPLLTVATASAHLGYGGRNFGIFTGLTSESVTISNQTISTNFGWADSTDADFGDSHKLRPFRFTLENTTLITITVAASVPGLFPGFSIYEGLGHLSPAPADYDTSVGSMAYLATLSGTYEGVFNALADFKMGNDDGDLSSFTFKGYAVDGTSANFGPVPGVVGDGNADGTVSGTFELGPGDYTLFIGGANYAGQNTPADTATYAMSATVSTQAVPEPTSVIMLGISSILVGSMRHRRQRSGAMS